MMPDIVLRVGDKEIDRVNFGVVPINSESEIELSIFNKGKNKIINLEIKPLHPDVTIVEAPKELDKNKGGLLKLRYRPKSQVDQGINSELVITGGYIV